MEEMVPIVDDDNNIVKIEKRSVMRQLRLPHRASYVFLRTSSGKFYVEIRSLNKDYCPGMLDACIGRVFQTGDNDIYVSAKRELYEEMGVDLELEELGWFKIETIDTFIYAGLFYAEYDGPIKMQESEVRGVVLMSEHEIMLRSSEFTPDSVIALREILKRKEK